MNFGAFFKNAGKTAAENSPAILTALAVTGTLTTAYLAAVGAFKASDKIREEEDARHESNAIDGTDIPPIDLKQQFDLTWKLYIPAAASAALTIAAIICVNQVGERRAAAMSTAFAASEKAFSEYKKKTVQKVGKAKEQAIRDEIAQERVDRSSAEKVKLVGTSSGNSLCYDSWSGRFFPSDIETIRKAVNDFNATVINDSYASLTEFWNLLGLPPTRESDYVGWTTDKLLSITHTITTVGGDPCVSIDFESRPTDRYTSPW